MERMAVSAKGKPMPGAMNKGPGARAERVMAAILYMELRNFTRLSEMLDPERVRVFYLSMDQDTDIPILTQRVDNSFRQFGDDMLRAAGLGGAAVSDPRGERDPRGAGTVRGPQGRRGGLAGALGGSRNRADASAPLSPQHRSDGGRGGVR